MRTTIALLMVVCMVAPLSAETLTLPMEQRPTWLRQDGIVMAGSWEPLPFRVRRDGGSNYTPSPEQLAAYHREQSPEMLQRLKALGVNFVMMHCYKGGGLKAERESIQDAVRFSRLCHEAGLRVGVYNYSGAFIWETFFEEMPQARDWLLLNAQGNPLPYSTHHWRYFWNRNHPDAQAFYRGLVKIAVQDIQTDLIHFDNHDVGPGWDPVSAERFRRYLAATFNTGQLHAMGIADLAAVRPPSQEPTHDLVRRAWVEFSTQSLNDAFADMARYARTLREDILMECNPGGPGEAIRPPIDHGRLLQGGDAFWDEGRASGYFGGRLQTRIRTYKIARQMKNVAFAYTTSPVEAAEAMAFNLDCLGCICWFEYGNVVFKPGETKPASPDLAPYIRFFHGRRDLLRNAEVVADAAILRSFPSQAFAEARYRGLTGRAEESLIAGRCPFQIIHDDQLADLGRYRVLVLAGCIGMSNRHIEQIKGFVRTGGRLCVIGPVAEYDEWLQPRAGAVFANLPADRVTRLDETADAAAGIRTMLENDLSIAVEAEPAVCMELTQQGSRRLVHLVNYRPDRPVDNVQVRLKWPARDKPGKVKVATPQHLADQDVPFTSEPGGVLRFRVPRVDVYAVAVVE